MAMASAEKRRLGNLFRDGGLGPLAPAGRGQRPHLVFVLPSHVTSSGPASKVRKTFSLVASISTSRTS